MPSRTSCFNTAVFRKTITRFWPLWAAYAVIWLLILPLSILSDIRWGNAVSAVDNTIYSIAHFASPVMTFAFGVLAAMAAFHWLYTARSAGFYTALPITREGMFLSSFAAGLSMLLAGNVLGFLGGVLACLPNGAANLGAMARWLAITCLDTLSFYGFAALCAMLTGSLLILPLVYAVLQFTAVAVEQLLDTLYTHFVFGAASSGSYVSWLSPLYYRISHTYVRNDLPKEVAWEGGFVTYSFQGWGVVIAYAVAGLVFALCALALYKRRRMETASDVVAIRALKPVFRVCLALAGALGLGVVLFFGMLGYESAVGDLPHMLLILLFLLLGGFIGWFAADMLMYKSFKVFHLHWKGWVIFSAVVCLACFACELDVFGVEKRLPAEGSYDRVRVMGSGQIVELQGDEALAAVRALHESIVEDKALHEQAEAEHASLKGVWLYYYNEDEQGRYHTVMERSWTIAATEKEQQDMSSDLRALERIFNLPEAVEYRKDVGRDVTESSILQARLEVYWTPVYYDYYDVYRYDYDYYYATGGDAVPAYITDDERQTVTLTQAEAWELYSQCILPDIAEGTLGRIWLVEDETFQKTIYNLEVYITFGELDEDGSGWSGTTFRTVPTVDSYRTNAWLTEHGIVLETYYDALRAAGY